MLFSSRVWQVFAKLWRRGERSSDSRRPILIHGMNYAPEFIGVGKYTTELAVFLAQRGYAVEVVTALPHYPSWTVWGARRWSLDQGREDGVRVTRCPLIARSGRKFWRLVAPLSFAAFAAPVVLWRALRSRPDTVLCVEPTLFAAPAALLAARLVGARTVLHVQDLELEAACATGYLSRMGPLVGAARVFERTMRRRFDAVVTISGAMAARLQPQVAPAPVSVLRNWVQPGHLTPGMPSEDLRKALGVPAHCRLVLYSGNLGAKQGLPVLIEAARRLRADASICFLVVGDGVMAPVVRAAAAGLPNVVSVGLLPAELLGSLLGAADLHVLPQDKVASDLVFPSKLGPLLMTGKPLVVTAEPCSELAQWLGRAALRSPPGDGRALAAAISDALCGTWTCDHAQAAALFASLRADVILPAFELCLLLPERDPLVSHWLEMQPSLAGRQTVPTALA